MEIQISSLGLLLFSKIRLKAYVNIAPWPEY